MQLKMVMAVVLFVVAQLGTVCAKLTQNRGGKLIVLAEAFASGCLVCAALVHLLSDASKDLDELLADDASESEPLEGGHEGHGESYPVAALLCGLGALLTHFMNGFTEPLWEKLTAKAPAVAKEVSSPKISDEQLPAGHASEDSDSTSAQQVVAERKKDEQGTSSLSTGPVLLAALSVHSLLEGLSLGAAKDDQTWNLFLAIVVHKGIAGFALGVAWLRSLKEWRIFLVVSLVFSAVTPVGILIGQGVEDGAAGSVLKALAAGTFLYTGLTETAPGVRTAWLPGMWRAWQMFFGLCGYGAMAVLGLYV